MPLSADLALARRLHLHGGGRFPRQCKTAQQLPRAIFERRSSHIIKLLATGRPADRRGDDDSANSRRIEAGATREPDNFDFTQSTSQLRLPATGLTFVPCGPRYYRLPFISTMACPLAFCASDTAEWNGPDVALHSLPRLPRFAGYVPV